MKARTIERDGQKISTIEEYVRFSDLGIKPKRDKLGVAEIPGTAVMVEGRSAVKHLFVLRHSFSGVNLGQLANQAAVVKDVLATGGSLGDFYIVDDGKRYETDPNSSRERGVDLYLDHKTDPVIGKPFMEFVKSHAGIWKNALEDETLNGVLGFTEYPFLKKVSGDEVAEAFKKELAEGTEESLWTAEMGALRFYRGMPFEQYLFTQTEFKGPKAKETRDYHKNHYLSWWLNQPQVIFREFGIPEARESELYRGFVASLNEELFFDFANSFTPSGQISTYFIDLRRGKVWEPWGSMPLRTAQTEGGLIVSTSQGSQALVDFEEAGGGLLEWRIKEYQLSATDSKNGLTAVIAYGEEGGKRRFLVQDEIADNGKGMYPAVRNPDAVAGRVALAAISDVSQTWGERMGLVNRPHVSQTMRAIQTAVRVGVEEYAQQLLSSENKVIQAIEGLFS